MDLNYKIFMSNHLVRDFKPVESTGAHNVLSVHHMRLLFLLISKIQKGDTEFKTLTISFADFAKICNLSRGGVQYRKISSVIKELKTFEYEDKDKKRIRWLDKCSNIIEGKMILRLDDSLKDYLLDLEIKKKYTAFKLGYTHAFRSKYTYKIYMFFKSFSKQKFYNMPIETAAEKFTDNRYHTFNSIRDHILKEAVDEINEKSDILISYTPEDAYLGKIKHIHFVINNKSASACHSVEIDWPDPDESEKKKSFDPEKLEFAKSLDIEAYLKHFHTNLIKWDSSIGRWTHPVYDSLAFYGTNNWMRFSKGESGSLIDYLVKFGGYSFNDAIESVWQNRDEVENIVDKFEAIKSEVKKYKPPRRCEWLKDDMIKHLRFDRKIPLDIVQMLIDCDLLYPGKIRGNENCVPIFTVPGRICISQPWGCKYKPKTLIQQYEYWHMQIGDEPNIIYVCESPVDAVSLYAYNRDFLHKEDESAIYVAMGGLNDRIFYRALSELNSDFEKDIILAVDFDDAGNSFANKHPEYTFLEKPQVCYGANVKDWNDVLRTITY